MGRYIQDQSKVLGIFESGTYSVALGGSSFWIGQVTENSISDEENLIITHYLGTLDRNIDVFDLGPRDVTGTLTYFPQDARLIFWTIGSNVSTSGTNAYHRVSEIQSNVRQSAYTSGTLNPPWSFTLEDSKITTGTGSTLVRTINGVIPNSLTITASQGEKVQVSLDYIGQTLIGSAGATPVAVTEDTTTSYLWSHATVRIGVGANAGSLIDTAKEVVLTINQNREAPHYLNGSRDVSVAFNGNRDYILDVTFDLDSDIGNMLYTQFYKGGSTFNSSFDLNADSTAGSKHIVFAMSGCRIVSMENPTVLEGVTERTVSIRPISLTGSAWDRVTSGIYSAY